MLAARALFAFQACETEDVNGKQEPTEDALLGALLRAEERAIVIQHAENCAQFFDAWVKVQKARGRRGPRRR